MWELYRRLPEGSVAVAAGEHPEAEQFDSTHSLPIQRLPLKFRNWGLLNLTSSRQYWRLVGRLGKIIKAHRPDRLDCGKCLPEGLLAWMCKQRYGIPYLTFVHGEELTLARGSRELTWLTHRVLRGACRIVSNSHHTRGLLERDWGVPRARINVLHPGVDTTKFVPAPRDNVIRERLGWGDRPVILTVGALQKRKGQDMVIRALPTIRQSVPDVLYAIVGEGWERPYLEQLVTEHGVQSHVQFRGVPTDEELVRCYQQCDLFVLANRQVGWDFEGFGIVLLEAQACGKPVITGTSGGTAETLKLGETGEVVDCNQPDQLAEILSTQTINNGWLTTTGQAARNWTETTFAWSTRRDASPSSCHTLAETLHRS